MPRIPSTLRRAYDSIRPHLPRKLCVRNGVAARDARLLDIATFDPKFEQEYIGSLESVIRRGDAVTLVGGGSGISTVAASQAADKSGSIMIFEGSEKQIPIIEETVKMNRTRAPVDVQAGIVGSDVGVFPGDKASVVPPIELPACDVLGLDCEGSEQEIIEKMDIQPRNVVIEYHPSLGVNFESISTAVEDAGYRIVNHELDASETSDLGYLVAELDK